jgi:DNA modification methylase
MKTLPDASIDLFICDLPYGQLNINKHTAVTSNGAPKIKDCSWDVKLDITKFWAEVKRLRRNDNVPCIHFCNTRFGYELIKSNEEEFRYDLVWSKGRGISFLLANKQPMKSHEMIYIFSKKTPFYRRVDITGDFPKWTERKREGQKSIQYGCGRNNSEGTEGKRCALSVIASPSLTKRGGHPTEKSEALYRFLIERYSPDDGVILDPTFGSGNSVFTAHAMGRSAIGIEKDEGFYKKAQARIPANTIVEEPPPQL